MMPKAGRKPAKGALAKPTTEVQIYEAVPSIVRRNGLFKDLETVSVLLGNCEALRKAVTVYKEAGPANGEFLLKRQSTCSIPRRTPKVRWADEVAIHQPEAEEQTAATAPNVAASSSQYSAQLSSSASKLAASQAAAEPEAAIKAAATRSCLKKAEKEVAATTSDPAVTGAEPTAVVAAADAAAALVSEAAAVPAAVAGAASIHSTKQQQECTFVHVQRTAAAADQERAAPSPESPAAVAVVTASVHSALAPKTPLPAAAVAAAAAAGCQLARKAAAAVAAAAKRRTALKLSSNGADKTGIESPDTPGSVVLVSPELVAGHQEQLVAELKDRLVQLKEELELHGLAHRSSSSTEDEHAAEAAVDPSVCNKQQQLLMANAMRLASLCKQLRAVEEAAALLQESAVHGGDGKAGWPKLQTAMRSCQRTSSLRLSCGTPVHITALSREGSSSLQRTFPSPRHSSLHISIPSFNSPAAAPPGSSSSSSVPAVSCFALSPMQGSSPTLATSDANCSSNSSATISLTSGSTDSTAYPTTNSTSSSCSTAALTGGAGDSKSAAGAATAAAGAAAAKPSSGHPVLHTAARVAARVSRISRVANGQSPAHSSLSIAHSIPHNVRRQAHADATSHAHPAAAAAPVHSKIFGHWPALSTAKRFEARSANCGIGGSSISGSSSVLHGAAACAPAAARKGLKPQSTAAAAAPAAACRSPAVTDGGWPALHTAARCCARGSGSCTMGGSAAPGAFGRMRDACRKRIQQQETAEHKLLQQRCEQWQQQSAAGPAGVAVAQSEHGACGVRAESGAGANRWHYW